MNAEGYMTTSLPIPWGEHLAMEDLLKSEILLKSHRPYIEIIHRPELKTGTIAVSSDLYKEFQELQYAKPDG